MISLKFGSPYYFNICFKQASRVIIFEVKKQFN